MWRYNIFLRIYIIFNATGYQSHKRRLLLCTYYIRFIHSIFWFYIFWIHLWSVRYSMTIITLACIKNKFNIYLIYSFFAMSIYLIYPRLYPCNITSRIILCIFVTYYYLYILWNFEKQQKRKKDFITSKAKYRNCTLQF